MTGNTVTLSNGTETIKNITNSKLEQIRTKLNGSGFFDALNYYAPANNSQESNQYQVLATANGKLHGVYWSDTSKNVPEGLRNLPYILSYLLNKK